MTTKPNIRITAATVIMIPGLLLADATKDRHHDALELMRDTGNLSPASTAQVNLFGRTAENCVELSIPVGSFNGNWNDATVCITFDLPVECCDWEINTCSDYLTDTYMWLSGPNGICIEGPDDPEVCPIDCSEYDPDILSAEYTDQDCLPAGSYTLYVHAYEAFEIVDGDCVEIMEDLPARVCFDMCGNGDTVDADEVPQDYSLLGAYPNPFNPTTTVHFSLEETQNVKLSLMDIKGRELSQLHQGLTAAGEHRVLLDGGNLSSGTYFIRLNGDSGTRSMKVLLLK